MIEAFLQYKYVVVVTGLLFGGTPALLGFIYLMLQGYISFLELFLLVVTCTMIWDIAWYYIGRFFHLERVARMRFLKKYTKLLTESQTLHQKYSVHLLFVSRFIYGTSSLVQILCGMYQMRLSLFILANIASIVVWMLILTSLGLFLDLNLASLEKMNNGVEISALIFFVVMLGFYLIVKKIVKVKYRKIMESETEQ